MTKRILPLLLVVAISLSCGVALADERVPEGSWSANKDTPVTIDWFIAYDWFGSTFDPEKNAGWARILEDTGVTINFQSGNTDKLNMLIATQALPDVVTMDASASQRKLLESNGALAPLEPLIAEYAPDMNVPQSMLDWYRNADGNAYIICSYYYGEERTNPEFGGYYVTHNKNMVRTDILEQIGMTMDDLQTRDGMLEALRAVKAANIQYNGMDVTPWGALDLEMIATQFGWKPENKEDGKLSVLWKSEEYLEALKWANTLYNEGLMTDEVFTWDNNQRREAVAKGTVFAGVGWTNIHKDSRLALYSADNNATFLVCGRMDQDNEEPVYYRGINCAGWTGTMITANAKHKDRIIQLFSYLTQEVATLDQQYGTGVYDIVDGHVVMDPEKEAEFDADYNAAFAKYKSNFEYFIDYTIVQKYWPQKAYANPVQEDVAMANAESDLLMYDDKCFSGLDPDAGTDLAALNVVINDFWTQAVPTMVMAPSHEECEAIWRSSLEQIDAMGFQQVQDYRDSVFAANKERLGIEYAYPGNRD